MNKNSDPQLLNLSNSPMMKSLKVYLFFSLLFLVSTNFKAQTPIDTVKNSERVVVKMNNGDEFRGKIIKRDQNSIVLETTNGTLNLISSNVRSIDLDLYKGKFRFPNSNETRYFFGPSAIPIKKGKGYYQNVLLTSNFVNYGLTKNFSFGGGVEFISLLLRNPIWFLTPKVGFKVSERSHVGGGIIMAGFSTEGTATLGYGVYTFGSSESNLTIGAGYGLISGQFSNRPTIMVSGTHRVGNNFALLTENYFIPIGTATRYNGIFGFRTLAPKNSFDFGLIVIPEILDVIPAIPFIGYTRSF
jgi:small nuclear ribonucleoprotein (snRNP)-like protein